MHPARPTNCEVGKNIPLHASYFLLRLCAADLHKLRESGTAIEHHVSSNLLRRLAQPRNTKRRKRDDHDEKMVTSRSEAVGSLVFELLVTLILEGDIWLQPSWS